MAAPRVLRGTLLSFALLSMLPPFLIEVRAFSPTEAGGATGLVALASIVGSIAYGMLAGRIGSRPLILAAVVALIGTAVPAFHAGLSSPAGISFATLAVSGTGVLVAHVFASVPRLIGDPAKIGPANGLIAQIGSIGALTGPPLLGYLVGTHGWMALATLVAVFSVSFTVFMATAERAAAESAVA
jgi:MFS family permease